MNLTITEQKENKLLQQRKEVSASLVFQGATPSNTQVTELLAKELGTTSELVVIKSIKTRFGHQTANVQAVAYPSVEAKQKIEVISSHFKKKDKAAAPAAAEKK